MAGFICPHIKRIKLTLLDFTSSQLTAKHFSAQGKETQTPHKPRGMGDDQTCPGPGIQSQHTAYLTDYSAQVGVHITGSEGF